MARANPSPRRVGFSQSGRVESLDRDLQKQLIFVRLSAAGFKVPEPVGSGAMQELASDLFARYAEQSRLLTHHLPPVDGRIQAFLDEYAAQAAEPRVTLPRDTLILDRYGIARELSLPEEKHSFRNEEVASYRLDNGVLHNPVSDRRTTQGVFHIADVGLRVPADKIAVPLVAYLRLLAAAFRPPKSLLRLPYSEGWEHPVEAMLSLHLRPLVCPEVPGLRPEKRMELRFFAPGGLVSNLDFVESIFGNAGDPYLPENDAALDTDHFTGHSGCVVLAPHLRSLRKVDLGLPHVSSASALQREQGMCYLEPHELYNEGRPFKITLRDARGIMVTILADNYFGYCKKEVKTQISLSANLLGYAEEEHSGGALAFASFSLGGRFLPDPRLVGTEHRMEEALELLGDRMLVHPEGYASDREYPNVHLLPEDMEMDLAKQEASFTHQGQKQTLRILPGHHYLHPSGYKVRMEKHPAAPSFRLVGTNPEGTLCHKPCTVSGGGKSEISKSLSDAILYGPIYVGDFDSDMELVRQVILRDYSGVIHDDLSQLQNKDSSRMILDSSRSLGSVIKLLTPGAVYTDEHNTFIASLPAHVRAIVFAVKRFYRQEWGDDWLRHFSVDSVNGGKGHELKLDGRTLVGSYLRLGRGKSGAFRIFKLRQDFLPADKLQMEDDITASTVVPRRFLKNLPSEYDAHPSLKIVQNCEFRLFQRPDDAIVPGYDRQTEADMASQGLFASNFAPLDAAALHEISDSVEFFEAFSPEMKEHIARGAVSPRHSVCSAKPRIVDGAPTKNPRYLQLRPDLARPVDGRLAELGTRLKRRLPAAEEVVFPVSSVLSGRRNNPPDLISGKPIRPLCVFGPIHYQELPELFMDYVCSVTGKSPSTTGAGSEGALTKGPFNAISATFDLNAALVSMILTGYSGFSSAAGFIGPEYQMDHDISLLVPELWCRLFPEERDPQKMIERSELEPVLDFEWEGRKILGSRLGYRITERFVHTYFGRIFDSPVSVFTEEILRPEKQSMAVFVDGIENLVDAQRRAAELYLKDGSVEEACPPLKSLLYIMAHGHFEGKGVEHPEIRSQFTREWLLRSDYYQRRLKSQRAAERALLQQHLCRLREFGDRPGYHSEARRLEIDGKIARAEALLSASEEESSLQDLAGTLGRDPALPLL